MEGSHESTCHGSHLSLFDPGLEQQLLLPRGSGHPGRLARLLLAAGCRSCGRLSRRRTLLCGPKGKVRRPASLPARPRCGRAGVGAAGSHREAASTQYRRIRTGAAALAPLRPGGPAG